MHHALQTGGRLAAMLALTATLAGCGAPPAEPPPAGASSDSGAERIVAEVNGTPIYAVQLERVVEAERLSRSARGEPVAADGEDQLRRDALRLLISGELVAQAARAAGLQVSPEEIERRLAVARSQFESDEAFDAYLRAAGSSREKLRARVERELLMKAWVDAAASDVTVDADVAQQIYRDQAQNLPRDEEVRAAHIIVRVLPDDPPAKREAARRKIDEALRHLRSGEPFEEIARRYSESPFAERGGDLGFFGHGRTLPEFEQVVFATPVGQVTDVFETRYGFNIVKVLERREGEGHDFDDVRAGLLMVMAREQGDEHLRGHVKELWDRADVKVLDPALHLEPGP